MLGLVKVRLSVSGVRLVEAVCVFFKKMIAVKFSL